MIVVSDTTPIISLMKIKQLELLEKLFGTVKIPVGVFEELTANPLYQEEVEQIKRSSFIEIVSVKDIKSVAIFRKATGLDKGESEAIVLTEEIQGDSLLMDERKGRQVASQMGITTIGTLGILFNAYEEKILTTDIVVESIDEMRSTGIRISDSLYNELLEKIQSYDK